MIAWTGRSFSQAAYQLKGKPSFSALSGPTALPFRPHETKLLYSVLNMMLRNHEALCKSEFAELGERYNHFYKLSITEDGIVSRLFHFWDKPISSLPDGLKSIGSLQKFLKAHGITDTSKQTRKLDTC